ncbi:CAAX amino terminal protease [Apiospora sp. TS-2023a]
MPSITNFLTKPPPITTGTAAALLVIYTLVYVLPFYLSPLTRPSRALTRDAPSVIRARITSVSFSCIACSAATLVILTSQGQATYADALHSMGYWPLGLVGAAKSLLLTAILFLGPLYEALVVDEGWRDWTSFQPVTELFKEWTTWRNIIAGPFTEEVLFRSASVPLMLLAHTSVGKTIFLSPVIFGLAHLHHFYEFRISHPGVPVVAALMRSLLQLTYTSLFGAYATFVFLRTGSLLAIFVVHAFCNCMGFPRFWGRVEPSGSASGDSESKPSVVPSIVYYTLLCVGAFFWWKNLGTLTQSDTELVPITI